MNNPFKIGDRVECVNLYQHKEFGWVDAWASQSNCKVGRVYTVIGYGHNKHGAIKISGEGLVGDYVLPVQNFKLSEEKTMTSTEKLREQYKKEHAASGLKVGDRVKILFTVPDRVRGWNAVWQEEIKAGFTGVITNDAEDGAGFYVAENESTTKGTWAPYFCLERVEEPEVTLPESIEKAISDYAEGIESVFTALWEAVKGEEKGKTSPSPEPEKKYTQWQKSYDKWSGYLWGRLEDFVGRGGHRKSAFQHLLWDPCPYCAKYIKNVLDDEEKCSACPLFEAKGCYISLKKVDTLTHAMEQAWVENNRAEFEDAQEAFVKLLEETKFED